MRHPTRKYDTTIEQVNSLRPGDVVYYRSLRYVFVRFTETIGQGYLVLSGKHGSITVYPVWYELMYMRIIPKERTRIRKPSPAYAFERTMPCVAADERQANDCTIRALSNALEMPYSEAKAYLIGHGFNPRHGMFSTDVWRAYRQTAYNNRKLTVWASEYAIAQPNPSIRTIRRTLNAWLQSGELPARCILSIRTHVLAVVNNVVLDTHISGKRSIVETVWAVTEQ